MFVFVQENINIYNIQNKIKNIANYVKMDHSQNTNIIGSGEFIRIIVSPFCLIAISISTNVGL